MRDDFCKGDEQSDEGEEQRWAVNNDENNDGKV